MTGGALLAALVCCFAMEKDTAMRDRDRLWITLAIWVIFGAITIMFFAIALGPASKPLGQDTIFAIVAALAAAATLSTAAVWGRLGNTGEGSRETQDSGKLKRPDPARLARLIESLDDDEIAELETLLKMQER